MKFSLKAYRVNANKSVKEAAEIAGVSKKTIYLWENDEIAFRKATLDAVVKLAKAYGISVDDLLP